MAIASDGNLRAQRESEDGPERTQEQPGHWPVYGHDRNHNHPGRPLGHQASLLGTTDASPGPGPDGLIRIWLDRKFVDRLGEIGSPGESYSDGRRGPRERLALRGFRPGELGRGLRRRIVPHLVDVVG